MKKKHVEDTQEIKTEVVRPETLSSDDTEVLKVPQKPVPHAEHKAPPPDTRIADAQQALERIAAGLHAVIAKAGSFSPEFPPKYMGDLVAMAEDAGTAAAKLKG